MQMHLQIKHYSKVVKGEKTIELRLLDDKRKSIKIGDIIQFYNSPDKSDLIDTKVIYLHKYGTFSELCDNISCKKCGFNTKEELLKSALEFYPIGKQLEFGVLGIEIERI